MGKILFWTLIIKHNLENKNITHAVVIFHIKYFKHCAEGVFTRVLACMLCVYTEKKNLLILHEGTRCISYELVFGKSARQPSS